MRPSRPLLIGLLSAGALASGATPVAAKCVADNYCDPIKNPNLRSAKVVGGAGALTVTVRLRAGAPVRITVTRAGRTVGIVGLQGRKGTNLRTVRTLRGKALRRGAYRVRVSASGSARLLTARVR